MDSSEREHIATVLNYFWGGGTATPHSVNENTASVAYEALEEAQSCSASMDLVPRPVFGRPGIGHAVKEVAKIGKRIASGDTEIYESCRRQVASTYRIKIEMALQGI
ncbi:hypothetical protein [Marinobacter sp. V034]|uniref:hypothetical protein n=1 Tax=Marinobacter sp. V034 TaxID=3459610 RepID=UPI004044448A